VVGFFVIDPVKAKKYSQEKGKTNDKTLMDDAEFKQLVFDDLNSLAN
jgi:hypothetical protein